MKLKIGTRGSRLALIQTQQVIEAIISIAPETRIETVVITTKGDRILDKSLDKIGDKGLFVAEIEEKLRTGLIDLAIHSMKDLPSSMDDSLELLPVLRREDPRDVLVTKHKIQDLYALPSQAIIGTGSKRRRYQLLNINQSFNIVPIRGNVETRIQKMQESTMDGTILAYAGIKRLGLISDASYTIMPLNVHEMIPAPAQGILGCQLKKDAHQLRGLMEKLIDPITKLQSDVERTFLQEVKGSCHMPMGAYLEIVNASEGRIYGLYGDEDGKVIAREDISCSLDEAHIAMKAMARRLVERVKA